MERRTEVLLEFSVRDPLPGLKSDLVISAARS